MTANIVIEFADNNTAFHEAFGPAFQKLIENGYSSMELLTARDEGTDMPTSSYNKIGALLGTTMIVIIVFTISLLI